MHLPISVSQKLLPILLGSTLLLVSGCSFGRNDSNAEKKPATSSPANSNTTAEAKEPEAPTAPGALNPGEASGTFTAKGDTVQLRYAYAGRGKRFGSDSVIVLITDQPIPADALAEELESQTMLLDEKIRGLEYVFMDDSYWVRFHPGQYQESKSGKIQAYVAGKGLVSGSDEDKGDMTDGRYARSVKFIATLP